MISALLSLRYADAPVREPAAFYLPGDDPRQWLANLSELQLPLAGILLYILPRTATDLAPRGALATLAAAQNPTPRLHHHGPARPFGCLAGRLYLPVEALLIPPISEAELAALLAPGGRICVWHPLSGLVGFDPGEGLKVSQLLAATPPAPADWSRAHPGLPWNRRLHSLHPRHSPTLEHILDAGRGDIGSRSDEMPDLARPSPTPQPGWIRRALATLAGHAARAAASLLGLLPRGAARQTWVDHAREWLAQLSRAATRWVNLEGARQRAVKQLLEMLESDPDRGLRFAIPFGGESHRGAAPPSASLAERDVNFNLERLGGGGPADCWDIPAELQLHLLAEYRRLAERELHLGRHRRAAYIFAELVNDVRAAAVALAAGGFFREAAVLYRDRLKHPLEAARCLEQGRLWAEALEIYEAQCEWEKVGDLARRLELSEQQAESFYRQGVNAALRNEDRVEAARLLDEKLHAPDEALLHLLQGWQAPSQSSACIARTFSLWGRLGRHAEARSQLGGLPSRAHQLPREVQALEELVEVAHKYPDAEVRGAAADAVRLVVSSRLQQPRSQDWPALLAVVRRLVPEDRLLARDCRRFATTPSTPPRDTLRRQGVALHRHQKTCRELDLTDELNLCERLGGQVECLAGAWGPDRCYLAGRLNGRLFVARYHWLMKTLQAGYCESLAPPMPRLMLLPGTREGQPLLVHQCGSAADRLQIPPLPADDFSGRLLPVNSPPWAGPDTLAIAEGTQGVRWALSRSQGTFVLGGYSTHHVPLRSQLVPLSAELSALLESPPMVPIPFRVVESVFYIGLGTELLIVPSPRATDQINLAGMIRGLAAAAPHTRHRLAIALESEVLVLRDEGTSRHISPLTEGIHWPVAAFINLGGLVVAHSQGCEVYSTGDERAELRMRIDWAECVPIAVLETGGAHQFAVLFEDGRLCTFRMPPE